MTTCEKCGKQYEVPDWPFCPHGKTTSFAIEPDDWPGGKIFENGFESPQTFYSKTEYNAALAARGLEVRAKWAGPADKHLKRWDAPSAKTLEDAKILLGRGAQAIAERQATEKFPITVRTLEPNEVGR